MSRRDRPIPGLPLHLPGSGQSYDEGGFQIQGYNRPANGARHGLVVVVKNVAITACIKSTAKVNSRARISVTTTGRRLVYPCHASTSFDIIRVPPAYGR